MAIARALASDAKVLLADEPTGSLDEATANDVTAILKRIAPIYHYLRQRRKWRRLI